MANIRVVFGPPGTGKTKYLTDATVEFVEQLGHPSNIRVVTFAKSAAQQLRDVLQTKSKGSNGFNAEGVCSTLHSLSLRISEIPAPQLLVSAGRVTKFIGEHVRGVSDENRKKMLEIYAQQADTLNQHELAEVDREQFEEFRTHFEAAKSRMAQYQFTDILTLAANTKPGFTHLLIDEAQDMTPLQWSVVRGWLPHLEEVIVAGDDDQALDDWAGSSPHDMLRFAEEFKAEQIVLKQSYRVPVAVHQRAFELLSLIDNRKEKEYLPRDAIGSFQVVPHEECLELDKNVDTMILYRNHSLASNIRAVLMARFIPFYNIGYDFNTSVEVLARSSGAPSKSNNVAPLDTPEGILMRFQARWRQEIEKNPHQPLTGGQIEIFRKASFPHLHDIAMDSPVDLLDHPEWVHYKNMSTFNYLMRMKIEHELDPNFLKSEIKLGTIHSSKGRESDSVILLAGKRNKDAAKIRVDQENEIRLMYVAMTRTQNNLTLVPIVGYEGWMCGASTNQTEENRI